MHWTLTTKANLGFLLLWLVLGGVSLWLLPPEARRNVAVAGVVLGTICGRLQSDAMRLCGDRLREARSAKQVLEALQSVGPGRVSRIVFYVGMALLFALSLGQGMRAPLAVIASFCAFAFARDSITLPRVLTLADKPGE